MKEVKIDRDSHIVNLMRENEALKFQNTTLQSKIASLENQYRFELALLKHKNEELAVNSKAVNDFKNIEYINQQLQRKVHRYRGEIIKKNSEINGLIFENKKLLKLSFSHQSPPLQTSSQVRKDEINTVYEEQEENDEDSTLILRCPLSPDVNKFKQSLRRKAVIRDKSLFVAQSHSTTKGQSFVERLSGNFGKNTVPSSPASTKEQKPK